MRVIFGAGKGHKVKDGALKATSRPIELAASYWQQCRAEGDTPEAGRLYPHYHMHHCHHTLFVHQIMQSKRGFL